MEISLNLIEDAVGSGNLEQVRKALIEYIRREPENSQKIVRAVNYAKEHVSNLFDLHDGKQLQEQYKWDKEYFLSTLKDLNHNFSEERFNHLCLVGAFIYPTEDVKEELKDTIIINNTEPVTDPELKLEKVKTLLALGTGVLIGFFIGKNIRKRK